MVGGKRGPGSKTTVGCEGAQLCGIAVLSASRVWPGPCPEDHGHFSSSRKRICDCMARGFSVLSNLARMAYPKPTGASARGEKKLI